MKLAFLNYHETALRLMETVGKPVNAPFRDCCLIHDCRVCKLELVLFKQSMVLKIMLAKWYSLRNLK